MIVITGIAFGLLLYITRRLSGSLLSPPCLFVLSWTLAVWGLVASHGTLYPVSLETLLVYLIGAVSFAAGGILALGSFSPVRVRRPVASSRVVRILLDVGLLLVVVCFPLYWRRITSGLAANDFRLALTALRAEAVLKMGGGTFSPVANLVNLAVMIAMAMHFEDDGSRGRRVRTVVAIATALVYGAATGTKGNALMLIVALFTISSLRQARFNFRQGAILFLVSLLLFGAGLRFVNYGYMEFTGAGEMLDLLLRAVQSYWLGGLVAFDRIVTDPLAVESTQRLSRFFLETANSLGAHHVLPSLHAPYTDISPRMDTNVYTIYFSFYRDFGVGGIVLGLGVIGYLLGLLFVRARRGGATATILYGILAGAILLTIHGEHFVHGLNHLFKEALFLVLVYGVAGRCGRRRTVAIGEPA